MRRADQPGVFWDAAKDALLDKLLSQEVSPTDIAQRFGISRGCLYRRLHDRRRERGELLRVGRPKSR